MATKLEMKNVSKIFGYHPIKNIHHLKEGLSKDELFKKIDNTVGTQVKQFQSLATLEPIPTGLRDKNAGKCTI
ncbi:hypothetical protein CIL05_20895 [Virgibacillus profundi]|uniref:Uncharacterized protein n=1 Tax=Virgibacillus profundi TaxID=2024555 RepID=A0A2A2I8L9_9BACI|nr:hypothetical protein [Virgibacillus profundi]PAV27666.1 hypothetical protein CIL05_20895 [Virgibacillus profundi]PXY51996.1 hypothetical protein CIT14_20030 [Virgibacillus profundi]